MVKKIGLFMGFAVYAYAGDTYSVENINTYWIWIALFTLGIIGIFILFFSSRQMLKIQKMHESVLDKQLEMEKNQALILTGMSENIHNMAKEALNKSNEAVDKVNAHLITETQESVSVHDALLDVTNDLIDFLRLKSRKVEIVNEEFNLNNVLNEVSGTVASHFKGSNVELIFDIDNTVPRFIYGDSLHFGQILTYILESRLASLSNEELRLEISMYNTYEEKIELQFQLVDNGPGMTQEEVEKLFVPYYDEVKGQHVGLGLFVAQELVSMMNGTLSIHSQVGKGTSFTLTIPFDLINVENQRKYRLPDKILTDKKVFIVDSNFNSALAIKKMFAYFKHDVKVLSKEKFLEAMPKLTPYDIVVLEDDLFNIRTINYLKTIKEKQELKVVSLSSLLNTDIDQEADEIIDKRMYKPLNQERIFEMITTMYELKVAPSLITEDLSEKVATYRSTILETYNINQRSFNIFSQKRLLIVEDNRINQKVLLNILKFSGMHIDVANNGAEAVKMIKKSKNKEPYDLVLMDINMPVMDGYAATKLIRMQPEFDTLPVVAFTALVLESEIEKMFNSGVNAFLSKPLNIGKLYTAMAMYILDMPNKYKESEDTIDHKHDLPGIDTDIGIKHSNGNEALYMEILNEFSEAYGKSDELFAKLVEEHRYEQLKMLCLDMRGLSATIGAQEMQYKIEEVQKLLLYNKHDLLPEYVDIYQKELSTLVQSIEHYLQGE
jgi:CheY-like chemotaxis protein